MDVNNLSFIAIVLASVWVLGVSVFGAARIFPTGRFLAGIGALTMIPIWFVAQILMFVIFDELITRGIATREWHLDYAITPLLNLAGAALVWYVVMRLVRRAASPESQDSLPAAHSDTHDGAWSSFSEPRKIAGAVFILIGAAAIASWFFFAGTLLVVVGVSLIMNVQIWRRK